MAVNNSLWADNAEATYGSLLCTYFNADCQTTSWGGMGLVAGDTQAWTWPTLPDVYPSALAWQVELDGPGAPIRFPWNASRFVPDGVVVNLGTNDAAGGRFNNATFVALFVDRFVSFVQNISASHRTAPPTFFLAFGPMTTAYEPALQAVLPRLSAAGIAALPLNLTLDAPCECGHPSAADHLRLAQMAQPVIAKALGW